MHDMPVLTRCLVNSAQNQLGPILTWPKTNSAQLNNQLGPRYVPTRPKHDSSLFLYYFLPFLTPICPSIRFFSFFHEFDYLMALRYKTLEYEYVWLCTQYIQHCMDLQLAVDPYKRPVLFESTDWLSKIHRVSWHISANQISTKHSPTAVVWYEESWLQFLQKSDTW